MKPNERRSSLPPVNSNPFAPSRLNRMEQAVYIGSAFFAIVWLLTLVLPETQSFGELELENIAAPEVRDSWRRILLAGIAVIALSVLGFPSSQMALLKHRNRPDTIQRALIYFFIGACIFGLTLDTDPFRMWTGLDISSLSNSIVILAGVATLIFTQKIPKPAQALTAISIALIAIGSAFTLPGLIRDSGHFEFVSEELASVAAGKVPQLDTVSQYTSVFPWIFSPILRAFPEHSALVLLSGLSIFQVVLMTVVLCFGLGILKDRTSHAQLLAVLLVASAPFLVSLGVEELASPAGRSFLSVSSYFQVFPLRIFFPILASYLFWSGVCYSGPKNFTKKLLITMSGVTTFLAFINNAEFGIPTVIMMCGLVVFLKLRRVFSFRDVLTFAGSLLVPLILLLLILRENFEVTLNNYLYFPAIFGLQGYLSVPAPFFGVHISFIAFFLCQIFIAATILGRTRTPPSGYWLRQGLAMLLAGGLGMISISYYLGRSLPPTAISGSTVFLALSASTLVPFLMFYLRVVRASASGREKSPPSTLPIFASVVIVSTIALGVQGLERQWALVEITARGIAGQALQGKDLSSISPEWVSEDFSSDISRWVRLDEELAIASEAQTVLTGFGVALNSASPLHQLLPMSNLVQGETAIPSSLVFSHPSYVGLNPDAAGRQCQEIIEVTEKTGSSWFLMRDSTWVSLGATEACGLTVLQEIEFETSFPHPVERDNLIAKIVHLSM